MKRGTNKLLPMLWSPIGVGVRRSSDGLWERNGKLLPWLWINFRDDPRPGMSIKLGEYMIYVYWFGRKR